jgi:hypothetical protein
MTSPHRSISMPVRPGRQPSRWAVGLYRVSTAEQGHSGLGFEAQRASVRACVAAQGWTLVAEHEDVASGKDDHRPGFQAALARCRQLGAVLVAGRLDRITRRAHTLSQLLEKGVSIRAADMPGADELMLRIYAAMARGAWLWWSRSSISHRQPCEGLGIQASRNFCRCGEPSVGSPRFASYRTTDVARVELPRSQSEAGRQEESEHDGFPGRNRAA